ncbi:uncharacterized protein EDB93DRAFT_1251001 [Suillus bovinus]|uniref:uncharacterized protein n=1 Tax=Suillus bovinus TaxID=48563 RepID=UPI001B85D25A|nr:uncharacterized protein EDB93DRAFT_1251001 [Suillus bovinus]KAG2146461.1 hypothetical protein EDB93DRAFT_1251001 [Suillus bovinus]
MLDVDILGGNERCVGDGDSEAEGFGILNIERDDSSQWAPLQHLAQITKLPGFSSCVIPGESSKSSPGDSASTAQIVIPAHIRMQGATTQTLTISSHTDILETQDELEEEEEDSETVEAAAQALHDVLWVSAD